MQATKDTPLYEAVSGRAISWQIDSGISDQEGIYQMSKRRKEILTHALKKWTLQDQLFMLIEESAELISAVNRYVRKRDNSFPELLEEMADVEILIEQIKISLCFGTDKHRFNVIKSRKMIRLAERVRNEAGMVSRHL